MTTEHTPREEIAKDYELDAIRLERFIKNYVPLGWKEPIGTVMTGFMFSAEDIKRMETDYREGVLRERIDERYKNPNVTQAILEFFEKNDNIIL